MKKEYSLEEQGAHNRDFVNLQIKNLITKLFKDNLTTIEEDLDSKQTRKKILDNGNDTIREVQNLLDVFDFYINPERLESAKNGKKTTKKVITNGSFWVK